MWEYRARLHGAGAIDGDGEWPFVVRTEKADSFGRWLAEVHRTDDPVSLTDAIIATGHGVAYRGRA